MSASITSSLCALCRRPLPAADGEGSATRLCDNCRKMVDNIRPTAARGPATSPNNASTPQAEPMPAVQMPSQDAPNSIIAVKMPRQESLANPFWANTPSPKPLENPGGNSAPRQEPPANNGRRNPLPQELPSNTVWSDVVLVPSDRDSQ